MLNTLSLRKNARETSDGIDTARAARTAVDTAADRASCLRGGFSTTFGFSRFAQCSLIRWASY